MWIIIRASRVSHSEDGTVFISKNGPLSSRKIGGLNWKSTGMPRPPRALPIKILPLEWLVTHACIVGLYHITEGGNALWSHLVDSAKTKQSSRIEAHINHHGRKMIIADTTFGNCRVWLHWLEYVSPLNKLTAEIGCVWLLLQSIFTLCYSEFQTHPVGYFSVRSSIEQNNE
jgi:hypothetical protein